MKTVNELYTSAKAIMFEKPSSTIYDNYVIDNINTVLAELFEENNICRVFNKKHMLSTCPQVSSVNDTIDFEPEYEKIIPTGLAMYFLFDDDMQKYSDFATRYNNKRVLAQKMVPLEALEEYAPED